jgi:predicted O-methyltransferase YrrM
MPDIVSAAIEQYAEEHTSPSPPWLEAVDSHTRMELSGLAGMMVRTVEGRFLELLVFGMQARRVLEIGAFTGYSSLSMAAGLPEGGHIVTCELDPVHASHARGHIATSPFADRIEVREGPALETITSLDGPFDLVFIDADKGSYVDYYEATIGKLAPTGLLLADNTLWSGRVVDETDESEDTVAIRRFNDHVLRDPRVVCVQLSIRDGVTMVRLAPAGGRA